MTKPTNDNACQQELDDDLFSLAPRHPDSRLETDWLFLYNKLPPDQWFGADYAYKTSGWLKVHTNIRKRQRILVQISEAYISGEFDWSEYRSQILKRINMHVLKLHQHHGVEDDGFFPEFVSMYPKLAPAFEILGHDHEYLNELARMASAPPLMIVSARVRMRLSSVALTAVICIAENPNTATANSSRATNTSTNPTPR